MIEGFYSYIVEQADDDSVVYSFITQSGIAYSVYFRLNEYDDFLEDFPNLFYNSCAFGFYRISKPTNIILKKDDLLYATISHIVNNFIQEHNNNLVLLYHCDYADGKQVGRERIFSSWYNNSGHKHSILKNTIELILPGNDGKEMKYYIGYLTSSKNSKKEIISQEFETFALNLIANKNN